MSQPWRRIVYCVVIVSALTLPGARLLAETDDQPNAAAAMDPEQRLQWLNSRVAAKPSPAPKVAAAPRIGFRNNPKVIEARTIEAVSTEPRSVDTHPAKPAPAESTEKLTAKAIPTPSPKATPAAVAAESTPSKSHKKDKLTAKASPTPSPSATPAVLAAEPTPSKAHAADKLTAKASPTPSPKATPTAVAAEPTPSKAHAADKLTAKASPTPSPKATPAAIAAEPTPSKAHAADKLTAKTSPTPSPKATPTAIAAEPTSSKSRAEDKLTAKASPTPSPKAAPAAIAKANPAPAAKSTSTALAKLTTPATAVEMSSVKKRGGEARTTPAPSVALAPSVTEIPLTKVSPTTITSAKTSTAKTRTAPATSVADNRYPWKTNIVTTVFWIGEKPAGANFTPNCSSSWDANWAANFGGFDNPDPAARRNYIPVKFTPRQNPFYVALPYNDVTRGTTKPEARQVIPWFREAFQREGLSVCRDRWIAIRSRSGRVAYAQWSDCGPFRTDHWQYVFGNDRPRPNLNAGAGLDASPAVRDYLGLESTDVTDWKFVDFKDVPNGPWALYGENNTFAQRSSRTKAAIRTNGSGRTVASSDARPHEF